MSTEELVAARMYRIWRGKGASWERLTPENKSRWLRLAKNQLNNRIYFI